MGILELIEKFDPFLGEHISRCENKGRETASYISSTICNGLTEQMGEDVLSTIIDEIYEAKYFSICVDPTPDVSDIDQLTFIV